jgi:hypothetical protein
MDAASRLGIVAFDDTRTPSSISMAMCRLMTVAILPRRGYGRSGCREDIFKADHDRQKFLQTLEGLGQNRLARSRFLFDGQALPVGRQDPDGQSGEGISSGSYWNYWNMRATEWQRSATVRSAVKSRNGAPTWWWSRNCGCATGR